MEKKPLPIGIEDFKEVIDLKYYFVDKTLMIKELIESQVKIGLFTRPRRFGKTLNMSMLQRFFEKTEESNAYLFDGLKISTYPAYMKYQGHYPVISISLKSMKQANFAESFDVFKELIRDEMLRHKNILFHSSAIEKTDLDKLTRFLELKADKSDYNTSICFLSKLLATAYNQKVIILIDEYDVPLENAFHQGFYTEMVNLIRSVFESALKTNASLDRAFLTGCLRVSRESIFTGLNNLQMFSIMSTKFDDSFGFTQEEIDNVLEYYHLTNKSSDIKHWYDGYKFNDVEIYNPWSVLNYISEAVEKDSVPCKPYWSNTSSNEIVKRLIEESNDRTKNTIEELINGTPVRAQIYEDVTYGTIDINSEYIWSFLLFTGYLKVISYETVGDETYYNMVIPNTEIRSIYKNTIRAWFEKKINADSRTDILESIIHGEPEKLESLLRKWLLETISCHDEKESYYHGFVTGLVSGFADYEVQSNVESGEGRFDLVIKQRSDAEYAAILEFKIAKEFRDMSAKCDEALKQIEEKKYITTLKNELYRNVSKYGISFCKKRCQVKFGGTEKFVY
ncbi:AAA family ATPase [Ruminococcus sp.]|uniref:AAA family ATPase n=1 Tax=Ruminococcus sp. TaxID=41978 RepID=UPI0025FB3F86|nr:AAA family ATPase [Ruminococcus sp.]